MKQENKLMDKLYTKTTNIHNVKAFSDLNLTISSNQELFLRWQVWFPLAWFTRFPIGKYNHTNQEKHQFKLYKDKTVTLKSLLEGTIFRLNQRTWIQIWNARNQKKGEIEN